MAHSVVILVAPKSLGGLQFATVGYCAQKSIYVFSGNIGTCLSVCLSLSLSLSLSAFWRINAFITKVKMEYYENTHKTRSTQRAHTSAERQHNRIVAVLPGSGWWSGSSPKLNSLVPTPATNVAKIRSQLFQLSDGQTDRRTNRPK